MSAGATRTLDTGYFVLVYSVKSSSLLVMLTLITHDRHLAFNEPLIGLR